MANIIRQHKIQDGVDNSLLAEVNSLKELHVADSTLATIGVSSITLQTNSLSVQTASLSQLADLETAIAAVETNQTDKSQFAKLTDGTDDADITTDSALKVFEAGNGLEIAKGSVTGTTFINKFGQAPDYDTGDNEVTVWEGANDGGINQMVYQYSSTADIDSIVSTSAGDTVDIYIIGLDTSYNEVTQTATLNGQTRVALGTSLVRVYRMINVGASDVVGVVSCYVNSSITAGVVDDPTQVRAIINNGNNETLMALYTVPASKKAYLTSYNAGVGGGSKSSSYIMRIRARPFGQVFQLKEIHTLSDSGTTGFQQNYETPEIFQAKTDIEMSTEITDVGVVGANTTAGFNLIIVDD